MSKRVRNKKKSKYLEPVIKLKSLKIKHNYNIQKFRLIKTLNELVGCWFIVLQFLQYYSIINTFLIKYPKFLCVTERLFDFNYIYERDIPSSLMRRNLQKDLISNTLILKNNHVSNCCRPSCHDRDIG